jgi:hypothetical protein
VGPSDPGVGVGEGEEAIGGRWGYVGFHIKRREGIFNIFPSQFAFATNEVIIFVVVKLLKK